MKIYLASRFERQSEMRRIRAILQEKGHKITSRWLDVEARPSPTGPEDPWHGFAKKWSICDLEDVDNCDILILDTRGGSGARGGMHVEFGYAFAKKKKLVIIGDKLNVFHYLPEVLHLESEDEMVRILDQG